MTKCFIVRSLLLLGVLALPACSTGKAAQQDLSDVIGSMGLGNLSKSLSTRPNGGVNTYDPSSSANLDGMAI